MGVRKLFVVILFDILAVSNGVFGKPIEDDDSEINCRIVFNNDNLGPAKTSAFVQLCLDQFPMKSINGNDTDDMKKQTVTENESNVSRA